MSTEFNIPTASPDVIPTNPSAKLRVVLKWITAATARDMDTVLATLSDDNFKHYLLPENFSKTMGFPLVRNGKAEFKEGFGRILSLLKTPSPTIHEVIESETKIVIHARGNGTSATGHPYPNEWMFIFQFEDQDSGEPKITSIKEFLDSLFMSQFIPAEVGRIKQLKGN